jgi:transcriptional regulator with XRE-family HTH domain
MQWVLHNPSEVCNAHCMSVKTTTPTTIPEWDLGDRLTKAMRHAGYTVADMAGYFDVHRNSISGWLHGRIKPDTRTLRLWAVTCGVPFEWLRDGTLPKQQHDGLLLPRVDSNHQPVDCMPVIVIPAPTRSLRELLVTR